MKKATQNEYRVIKEKGVRYVPLEDVRSDKLNISKGNHKTGNIPTLSLSIWFTCDHKAPCFGKDCYGCHGTYVFGNVQRSHSENTAFVFTHTADEIVEKIAEWIRRRRKQPKAFRFFGVGDIPNYKFMVVMKKSAEMFPAIRFYTYTKKYALVNSYIDVHGALPENLTIIFSHWMNDDGSFYPMPNPHNLPTSEYIPLGKEERIATVKHVCPCSDPTIKSHCDNCDHGCYLLRRGESMALLEHSTERTKERDRYIREAKAAL